MFGAADFHSPPNVVVLFGGLSRVNCIAFRTYIVLFITFLFPFIILYFSYTYFLFSSPYIFPPLSLFNSFFLVILNAYSIYFLISLPYHTDSNDNCKDGAFLIGCEYYRPVRTN